MSEDSIIDGRSSGNLNFKTAQKIIHQLLTQNRIKTAPDDSRVINSAICDEPGVRAKEYTKKELAEKLGITQGELEKLKSPYFCEKIANRIFLPLIRLYCATKFVDK